MKQHRGQALIEFIIVLPLFLLILYGVVDLVRVGIIKHSLDSACREGARVAASMPNFNSENSAQSQQAMAIIISRVNRVLMGSHIMQQMIIDGDVNNPVVQYDDASDIITVRVSVHYKNMFPFTQTPVFARTIVGEATSQYVL